MAYAEVTMLDILQIAGAQPGVTEHGFFSWDYLQDAYYSYFLTNPVVAVCLAAYVVVTVFLIVFLLQPRTKRTWTRPAGASRKNDHIVTPEDSVEIADLYCTPVMPDHEDRASRTGSDNPVAPSPKHMPSIPPKTDMATLHATSHAHKSAAILYVTDNDSSDHLIDSLGAAGLAVISCQPGKEAARHVAITKFDAIVIDTLVAEAARLCATRLLEALPAKPPVPVLIFAGSPGQTLNIAATNARIEYIFKPFDDSFLVAKVHSMIVQQAAVCNAGRETTPQAPLPYDKQMETLVDSLPAVADNIQLTSEQKSLNSIELQSGVIAFLGEQAAKPLQTQLDGDQPLSDEVKQTAEKVDELLRLCATIKPPKPQK